MKVVRLAIAFAALAGCHKRTNGTVELEGLEPSVLKNCDGQGALKAADFYLETAQFPQAIELARQWQKGCPALPTLLWKASHAHERLGQWKDAAALDTRLIEDSPRDADYWWWRAKNELQLGHAWTAAADLWQSLASGDLERYAGGPPATFVDASRRIKRPCDAAFALGRYIEAKTGAVPQETKDARTGLFLDGDCKQAMGVGEVTIKWPGGDPIIRATGGVGEARATFAIDDHSGLTLISSRLAAKAGLRTAGETARSYSLARLREGKIAIAPTLHVGGATARDIAVAITDGLPEGIDGVLGASFLWRFRTRERIDGLHLLPLATEPPRD